MATDKTTVAQVQQSLTLISSALVDLQEVASTALQVGLWDRGDWQGVSEQVRSISGQCQQLSLHVHFLLAGDLAGLPQTLN